MVHINIEAFDKFQRSILVVSKIRCFLRSLFSSFTEQWRHFHTFFLAIDAQSRFNDEDDLWHRSCHREKSGCSGWERWMGRHSFCQLQEEEEKEKWGRKTIKTRSSTPNAHSRSHKPLIRRSAWLQSNDGISQQPTHDEALWASDLQSGWLKRIT